MDFHRNGTNGYKGETDDHDLTATIVKTAGALPAWHVTVSNCGTEVDEAWYARLADAKWHGQAVASVMSMHGSDRRHDDLYPPFDATVTLDRPNGTGGRYR